MKQRPDIVLRRAAIGVALTLALPAFAVAATHTIRMEGMKFVPETVTVKRGDSIVWQNKDVVPHTATAKGAFDSGSIAPGKSYRHTVRKAGSYEVLCTFHPGMKSSVVVQ
jgi:plastocyanin